MELGLYVNVTALVLIWFGQSDCLSCRCNSHQCLTDPDQASFGECVTNHGGSCVRRILIKFSNTDTDGIRINRKRQQYRCENSSSGDTASLPFHQFRVKVPVRVSNALSIEYRCRSSDYCASSLLYDQEQCGGPNKKGLSHFQSDSDEFQPSSLYLLPPISPPERNLFSTICTCIRMHYDPGGVKDNHTDSSINEGPTVTVLEEKRNECQWSNFPWTPFQHCLNRRKSHRISSSLAVSTLRASLQCQSHSNGDYRNGTESNPIPVRCHWKCRYRHNCNNINEFSNVYCSAMDELRKTAVITVGNKEDKRIWFNAAPFGSKMDENVGNKEKTGNGTGYGMKYKGLVIVVNITLAIYALYWYGNY